MAAAPWLALDLSQIQAAEQLEISQAYLSLVERGTKTRLSATLQRKIGVCSGYVFMVSTP